MSRMKQWLDFWEKCKGKKGSPVLIGLLVGHQSGKRNRH